MKMTLRWRWNWEYLFQIKQWQKMFPPQTTATIVLTETLNLEQYFYKHISVPIDLTGKLVSTLDSFWNSKLCSFFLWNHLQEERTTWHPFSAPSFLSCICTGLLYLNTSAKGTSRSCVWPAESMLAPWPFLSSRQNNSTEPVSCTEPLTSDHTQFSVSHSLSRSVVTQQAGVLCSMSDEVCSSVLL